MIDDGLFLAWLKNLWNCLLKQEQIYQVPLLPNEGLFNTVLYGRGYVCLESRVPFKEIIVLDLENDTVSIDGSMAIAWTSDLELTVEKAGQSYVGSAISKEGLVNVYRGTGKILMAPLTDRIHFDDLPQSDK